MANKKILFVGSVFDTFTQELTYYLLKNDSKKVIDALPTSSINSFYDSENKYHSIYSNHLKYFCRSIFCKILYLIKITIIIFKFNNYNNIHIFSINRLEIILSFLLKYKTKSLIVSVYGSDYAKASKLNKWLIKRYLIRIVDKFVFTSKDLSLSFIKEFNIDQKQVRIAKFGLDVLNFIDHINKEEIFEFNTKYNIPQDKRIFLCGYSSEPMRQHIKIIDTIKLLPNAISSNSFFIFQMNYGDMNYRDYVEKYLTQSEINNYLVLKDMLSYKEIAILRKISNYIINIPTSDQFSASMTETFYAGNDVITGKWLPYSELWDKNVGAYILEEDSIESLYDNIVNAYYKTKQVDYQQNKKAIYELVHWDNVIKDWEEIYNAHNN